MKKFLLYSALALILLPCSSLIYTRLKLEMFRREVLQSAVATEGNPQYLAAMQATVNLHNIQNFFGRGYLNDKDLIFSNHHVLKKHCPETVCDNVRIMVKQLSNLKEPHTRDIVNSFCLPWLDLCVLQTKGWNKFQHETQTEAQTDRAEAQIFLLPFDEDYNQARSLRGRILFTGRVHSIMELPTRKGMSGSPVFGPESQILGLARGHFPDFNLWNAAIYRLSGRKPLGIYEHFVDVINREALEQVARCLEVEAAECQRIQRNLIIGMAYDYASKRRSNNLTLTHKISQTNNYKYPSDILKQMRALAPITSIDCDGPEEALQFELALQLLAHLAKQLSKDEFRSQVHRLKTCPASTSDSEFLNMLSRI